MDSGYKTPTMDKKVRQKRPVLFSLSWVKRLTTDKDGKISLAKTIAVNAATVLFLAGTIKMAKHGLNKEDTAQIVTLYDAQG